MGIDKAKIQHAAIVKAKREAGVASNKKVIDGTPKNYIAIKLKSKNKKTST